MATKILKNPEGPVTGGQSYFLMTLLGRSDGFAGFVPEWEDPEADEKATAKAATLLTEAGANKGHASRAIDFLRRSKPQTADGKARRRSIGLAHLFGQEVPQSAPREKAETVQIASEDLAALMSRIADLEAAQG